MALIKLDQVSVQIPVYSNHNRSMKNTALNSLLKNRRQITSVTALNKISINLKDGDRLGVKGPNGSGKTTLLRAIAGVYPPSTGIVKVKGKIASLIDISLGMDLEATGYENIRMRAIMMGIKLKQIKLIEEEIADFTELGQFLNMPIRSYSSGMHMRLGFAVSTAIPADIILMDEWLSVGDSSFILKAEKRLENFIKKTSILVIASHSNELLFKVTNKIINLEPNLNKI